MRRSALTLVAAGCAAMLVASAAFVFDGFRRRVEYAAVVARIAP